jgi:hypothetical protein
VIETYSDNSFQSKPNVVPIEPANSSRCSIRKRFCFYNKLSSVTRVSVDCLRLLFAGSTFRKLKVACPLHCRPYQSTEAFIIFLETASNSDRICAITNATENTEIICKHPNGTVHSTVSIPTAKSMEAHLVNLSDCLCSISMSGHIIRIPHPCRMNSNFTGEVRILMVEWSTTIQPLFIRFYFRSPLLLPKISPSLKMPPKIIFILNDAQTTKCGDRNITKLVPNFKVAVGFLDMPISVLQKAFS